MKGNKLCFGLLLLFSIMVGLSLNACLDVSALRHDYDGIALFDPMFPCNFILDTDTNLYYRDFSFHNDSSNSYCGPGTGFQIEFDGDSSSSFDGLNYTLPSSQFNLNSYDSESGSYVFEGNSFSLYPPILTKSSNGFYTSGSYVPDFISDIPSEFKGFSRQHLGSNGIPNIDISSVNNIFNVVPCQYGVPCGFPLLGEKAYLEQNILPFRYSYDGFILKSSAVDTESGMHYSNSFSLSDIFSSYVPSFSRIQIPLNSYDNFFYNPDNLYQGRSFEFKGAFEFDGNFSWHSNIENNGSSFRIYYSGTSAHDPYDSTLPDINGYFDCVTNYRTVTDPVGTSLKQLEYSCPFVLPTDFIDLTFTLQIDGNGNYVWLTDNQWRFAFTYLVTDNDETPGNHFNSDITGGGKIPGDAMNNIVDSDLDFFESLKRLFNFSFINPFAPLFNLFTSGDSCVQIPTIAGMIHSQETEICPWFDSSIRNIVTPVLGLSSMMLVFGFAVRWLGSSSGNMFEDSGSIEPPGFGATGGTAIHHGWRRKK